MDMIMTHKILHRCRLVDVSIDDFFNTTPAGLKILKPHVKAKLMKKYSFTARVINNWTSLPSYIVMATNINSFKTLLDVHQMNYRLTIL